MSIDLSDLDFGDLESVEDHVELDNISSFSGLNLRKTGQGTRTCNCGGCALCCCECFCFQEPEKPTTNAK